MPEGIRYMSEAKDYLFKKIPFNGKYILDKTLTGCGGTELFIGSGRPLVLVSPRTGVLSSKSQQHPNCHLLRGENTKPDELKKNLKAYLNRCMVRLFNHQNIPVILTTLDSAKYVVDELNYQGISDQFLWLVDEFQCLMSDAAYKGKTDLEFLKLIDGNAKNICYMSATPIDDKYLSALSEFQNIDYYKLEWDPSVIVEHTVKEIQMRKGESTVSILKNIINEYRRNGYFAKKIIGGQEYQSHEVVVFVNEVSTINAIIKANNLQPHETTILISESNKDTIKLRKAGFTINEKTPDKNNPINKTFTFCSKAAFEGRDFYSTNAFTYIFLDGTKDWQTHDIAIDLKQILGRQRLDINPFKFNATIYYRTKPKVESKKEFFDNLKEKMENSQTMLDLYNSGNSTQKKAIAKMIEGKNPNNPYDSNYIDVIHDEAGYKLEINHLVIAAEHNLWRNKAFFYNNPLNITTAIHTQMAIVGKKPQELRDFEEGFCKITEPIKKMKYYTYFRTKHPELSEALYQNPFIDFDCHWAYDTFGPDCLAQANFDLEVIRLQCLQQEIIQQCRSTYVNGKPYRAEEVKAMLQQIYDKVGFERTATATQLEEYMSVKKSTKRVDDGSRQVVFIVE